MSSRSWKAISGAAEIVRFVGDPNSSWTLEPAALAGLPREKEARGLAGVPIVHPMRGELSILDRCEHAQKELILTMIDQ